jgi:hypothetical protein
MAGEKLVNVKADTIEEFAESARKAIGEGKGEIGVTNYKIAPNATYDAKLVKKISFDIDISIIRAHWSGGKADARHKAAIETAEELNAEHEAKHKKIIVDLSAKLFKAAEKDLVGKSSKDVDAKITEITKAIDKANDDLDRKEGAVYYDDDESKDTITVKLTGA